MRVGVAVIAVVAVALVACGGGAPPPAQEPTSPPPVEDRVDPVLLRDIADGLLEVLATMATITETAPECPAMAVQLTQLFDQSAQLFDLAKTQGADPEASSMLTAELDQRAAAVEPLVARIQRGLARCQMDPAVAAAMERMPTF